MATKQPKPISITLLGEPRSTSHIYKFAAIGGYVRGYMSKEGVALKESYAVQAWHQYGKEDPILEEVEVDITLFFGTKRKADVDNFNKIVLDALSGIVWEDDSQIKQLKIRKDYDKERPRIELIVRRSPGTSKANSVR